MKSRCRVFIVFFLAFAVSFPSWAQQVPQGYRLFKDQQATGWHLATTRPGSGSATELLARALKEVGGFFDHGPVVIGGFRDAGDQRAEVFFRAGIQKTTVGGVGYAVVGHGTGSNGFVFDTPWNLSRNLPGLMQLPGGPAAAPGPAALNWQETPFPDGSGWMRLPDGWVITFAQKGMASAHGPHGVIERGIWVQVNTRAAAAQLPSIGGMPFPGPVFDPVDPVTALNEYTSHFNAVNRQQGMAPRRIMRVVEAAPVQPVSGYSQAAYIDYEYETAGVLYRSIQYVMLGEIGPTGSWIFYTTYVASPVESFPRNLPVLLEIWGSSRTARHVLQERIENAVQSLKEAGEIYRQAGRSREAAQQRMHDKWIEVIRGTRIVQDTLTGDQHGVNLAWSGDIVRKLNEFEGYDRFQEIPLWQLNR